MAAVISSASQARQRPRGIRHPDGGCRQRLLVRAGRPHHAYPRRRQDLGAAQLSHASIYIFAFVSGSAAWLFRRRSISGTKHHQWWREFFQAAAGEDFFRRKSRIMRCPTWSRFFIASTFVDDDHGWVVGELGRIWSTDNGGKTWSEGRQSLVEQWKRQPAANEDPRFRDFVLPTFFGVSFRDQKNGAACGLEGSIIAHHRRRQDLGLPEGIAQARCASGQHDSGRATESLRMIHCSGFSSSTETTGWRPG